MTYERSRKGIDAKARRLDYLRKQLQRYFQKRRMPKQTKDNGFRLVAGRPRLKPWEQRITATFRLTYETYQRIQRLSKREGITISKALEKLVRTEESERIEPTIPVDYSKIHHRERGYTVTKILDKHFK